MTSRKAIHSENAPAALGPYSQAIRVGDTVYLSGQIPLDPSSGDLVEGDIDVQARRVFDNLKAVAEAAGGKLSDAVKINISLATLDDFEAVNEVMREYFDEPYPARACVQPASLPRDADLEIEAILVLT